jgi:hypothetical protein
MMTSSRQLSDAEKLRKVILELVDTEKTYVKVCNPIFQILKKIKNYYDNYVSAFK